MSCFELVTEVDEVYMQALSEALLELGALSISSEDANANTADELPLFGEPGHMPLRAWPHARLSILFDDTTQPSELFTAAALTAGLTTVPQHEVRTLASTDWVDHAQAQFTPIAIGQRIWVVPSWSEHQDIPHPNPLILKLDPGLAFGTGSHPTTRLCMAWIEENVKPADTVLDYGCGSGILAILAKQCGAGTAVGIDIDPQALETAKHNSQKNQASVQYGLPEALKELSTEEGYDIVVANILLNPLISLAPMLCAQLKMGGKMVLSGILPEQVPTLIEAYRPWISLSVWRTEDEWACVAGVL